MMSEATICITPRYCRRYTDPGIERLEANCTHAVLDWQMPLTEAALLCVDIWDRDIHADMRAIDDRVTREKIVPVLEASRQAGLQVIHAPATPIAERHANWVNLLGDRQPQKEWPDSPEWPPAEFRQKTGPYATYARPSEPQREPDRETLDQTDFHELVRPVGDEPVIKTGEELHRLCAARGVLHLFYVGFHTPGCLTKRSYGIRRMVARGYGCILLRDCTNGMETHETFADKTSMRGTIAYLEQQGAYTLLSTQLIEALQRAK
jgi:nicotinamidase-related amidase